MADTPGDAATLYEVKTSGNGSDHDPTVTATPSHVNVVQAEHDFNALARQLSNQSQPARQRSASTGSTATGRSDIEKGVDDEDTERFDLREYLTSSNDANQRAGIKVRTSQTYVLARLVLIQGCRSS